MFVRLVFAMSTSLEIDVIVVDEALAVGDVAFQTRCFDRKKQLKKRGTTVLLVSHSTAEIIANVDRVLLLDHGKIVTSGTDVSTIVAQYESIAQNIPPSSGSLLALVQETRRESEKCDLVVLRQPYPVFAYLKTAIRLLLCAPTGPRTYSLKLMPYWHFQMPYLAHRSDCHTVSTYGVTKINLQATHPP